METTQPTATRRELLPLVAITALIILADQITKLWVRATMLPGQSIPEEGIFRLTHVTNTGSAFGILQGQTVLLIMASFIGIFGILAYYRTNGHHSRLLQLALGLVLAGAIGNLIDRLLLGEVTDFLDVQLWPGYHWPTFNIADSAIVTGLFLMGLYVLGQRRRPEPPAESSMPVVTGTTTDEKDPLDASSAEGTSRRMESTDSSA